MKQTSAALITLSLVLSLLSVSAFAEHTRVTYPDAVVAEIFGRGLRFGLGYDRVVNDDLAVGAEIGSVGMQTDTDIDTSQSATLISPYVNYYFQREAGSLFVTGGAALVANVGSVKNQKTTLGGLKLSGNAIVPQFGLGYENRTDTGFLFRVAFYGMVDRNVIPWVGFSLGYGF